MREIKFRAWDKRQCKMFGIEDLAFDPWGKLAGIYCDGPDFSNDSEVLLGAEADLDQAVLMQYTGLYDYAGTEIYEGDVLRGELGSLYEVEFNDGQFQPALRYGGTQVVIESIADMADYSSVIGNVYQNPELLEVRRED
jgi:uncharacterized phage protein (TIGR01671 family)